MSDLIEIFGWSIVIPRPFGALAAMALLAIPLALLGTTNGDGGAP